MTGRSTLCWLAIGLLLGVSCWSANSMLANWWAGGGPPTERAEVFLTRGNAYFWITCLLLALAGLLSWVQLRNRQR